MRAMWIASPMARRLRLSNEFFDLKAGYITPPGTYFLENAESLYGLWFITLQYYSYAMEIEERATQSDLGAPKGNPPLRTFQGRAGAGALATTREWLVVMLTTILEAYMKDILEFVANCDPSVVTRFPTDDAQSASKPEQARRWAQDWLKKRQSPNDWIKGFSKMGIGCFSEGLANRIKEMRDTRHLIVHSAGHVDEKYLRRRTESRLSVGERFVLSEEKLRDYINATFELFAPVEAHFVEKCAFSLPPKAT